MARVDNQREPRCYKYTLCCGELKPGFTAEGKALVSVEDLRCGIYKCYRLILFPSCIFIH